MSARLRRAALLFGAGLAMAAAGPPPSLDVLAGRAIAFDRSKGNCLACHEIAGGDGASTVGPALKGIKARFSDRKALFRMLWDEEQRNPQTVMPAFGKNLILDKHEIEQIIDFLYTL